MARCYDKLKHWANRGEYDVTALMGCNSLQSNTYLIIMVLAQLALVVLWHVRIDLYGFLQLSSKDVGFLKVVKRFSYRINWIS